MTEPVLVDTSVWVSHLRASSSGLVALLQEALVVCHPFVIGELALGNLGNRSEILTLLEDLPGVEVARHEEVMAFIEKRNLPGRGLGYVDVHLLASALLSGVALWTEDKRLAQAAEGLEFHYPEP